MLHIIQYFYFPTIFNFHILAFKAPKQFWFRSVSSSVADLFCYYMPQLNFLHKKWRSYTTWISLTSLLILKNFIHSFLFLLLNFMICQEVVCTDSVIKVLKTVSLSNQKGSIKLSVMRSFNSASHICPWHLYCSKCEYFVNVIFLLLLYLF